jgi:hypothetical protein
MHRRSLPTLATVRMRGMDREFVIYNGVKVSPDWPAKIEAA